MNKEKTHYVIRCTVDGEHTQIFVTPDDMAPVLEYVRAFDENSWAQLITLRDARFLMGTRGPRELARVNKLMSEVFPND